MVGFEKARGAVKVIKDQIQYRSQSLLNLARDYFRHRNSDTRLSTGHINSLFVHLNRQCSQPTGNFEEYDFNIFHNSYADFNQIFVTYFDDFDFYDCSYNDLLLYNSKNFFDFSEDLGQPMPLNQQPDRNHKASSRTICNRRFDKQRRNRSSRGGGGGGSP